MTLREASHQLYQELCPGYRIPHWLSSIGIRELSKWNDQESIVVYLKKGHPLGDLKEYNGYPVELKYFGEFAVIGKVEGE